PGMRPRAPARRRALRQEQHGPCGRPQVPGQENARREWPLRTDRAGAAGNAARNADPACEAIVDLSAASVVVTLCGSRAIGLIRLSAVVVLIATTDARAQDCESMTGPARTDCYIGRARIHGQQSGIAAGAARLRTDEEFLRAATGTSAAPKPHRAKSRR